MEKYRLDMKMLVSLFFICFSIQAMGVAKKMPVNLVIHRNKVFEIGAKLNTLEKELQQKNQTYHSHLEQIKSLESELGRFRNKLNISINDLKKAEEENNKILKNFILEAEDETMEHWQRKVHSELLKKSNEKYKNKLTELETFKSQIIEYENKLVFLKSEEEELAVVIRDLENRKKSTMDAYAVGLREKKNLEDSFERSQIKKVVSKVEAKFSQAPLRLKKPEKLFKKPLNDFLSLTSSEKGVTFKYRSVQPIRATDKGKVVFAGELASYGQVLLVDHGNDLRTVLLGKFDLKVKKNDDVLEGDILGTTLMTSPEPQNLYFEVRKKNVAQNTILWLDSGGVSKI